MAMEDDHKTTSEVEEGAGECRQPTLEDVIRLSRDLNAHGAKYVIVGGFAINQAGYPRQTMDIDLLVETGVENEAQVLAALACLPDAVAKEIKPGEVAEYSVVRVADEIMVDLMKSGCGITYADAIQDAVWRELDGVRIPFASKKTLWKMKQTLREKDVPDRLFLAKALTDEGIALDPPLRPHSSGDEDLPAWAQRLIAAIRSLFKRR
jgi:hypothetical protein